MCAGNHGVWSLLPELRVVEWTGQAPGSEESHRGVSTLNSAPTGLWLLERGANETCSGQTVASARKFQSQRQGSAHSVRQQLTTQNTSKTHSASDESAPHNSQAPSFSNMRRRACPRPATSFINVPPGLESGSKLLAFMLSRRPLACNSAINHILSRSTLQIPRRGDAMVVSMR